LKNVYISKTSEIEELEIELDFEILNSQELGVNL